MNRFKILSLSILLGLGAAGCTDILDENVNPDKAHEITPEVGLPTIVFYAQQTVYDHAEYGIYLSQMLDNKWQIEHRRLFLQERMGILDDEPPPTMAQAFL